MGGLAKAATVAKEGGIPLLDTAVNIANSAMAVHESRQNRRFQRDQSATVYQRGVKDLKKAGLNPVLAAGGPGAPVGSGAQPSINTGSNLAQGVSSLQQARTGAKQADTQAGVLDNQKVLAASTISLNEALSKVHGANSAKAVAEALKITGETNMQPTIKKKLIAEIRALSSEQPNKEIKNLISKWLMEQENTAPKRLQKTKKKVEDSIDSKMRKSLRKAGWSEERINKHLKKQRDYRK